jgi:2-C-methyl-D-erythritol 4-phosphate cytidylyltransferase/2-C-methyl-D-erythritol 2,4-cyclodiphosphate synthase
MSIGVIIVAAGRGQRVGGSVPKQFLDLGGRTVLQRSVAAFDAHPRVTDIVVVLPADLVGMGASLIGTTDHPCRLVAGGARRQDSVAAGLAEMPGAVEIVLIHDAARPFADKGLIDRVIAGVEQSGAALPALPTRDTVKRVDLDRNIVKETIARDDLWLAQTPQGFRRGVLAAVMAAGAAGADATDDATLAERLGHVVRVVLGEAGNVKITTPADLAAAQARVAPVPRVGTGYDLHRLVDGRALVLAGVTVPSRSGPLGHSDADVLCHAITDALLGAAGAGDIGRHFPDSDARWKDAPGLDLLGRAVAIVRERGFVVASVDATVLLERPKLAPHVDLMAARLAATLGVTADCVSVKGKTNEGVDAVGRGEAIAAHAVAVVVPGASG